MAEGSVAAVNDGPDRTGNDATGTDPATSGSPAAVAALHQLLSCGLPVHPSVRLGARHVVAAADHAAGGDWFDAMTLADGRLALVVGDVVGQGIAATVIMGQLRAVLRELLTSGTELTTVVARLDRYAGELGGAEATTVCVGVLDPVSGSLRYLTRGHPRPLVVDAAGRHRFLPATGAGPLCCGSVGTVREEVLAPGETLLLYTDGLIERPGRPLSDGMAELARVAVEVAADPAPGVRTAHTAVDRLAGQTLSRLTRLGRCDDAVLLAVQPLAAPLTDLHMVEEATPATAHRFRRGLEAWLGGLDLDAVHLNALHLAVTEAATNSIEHAYPSGSRGAVELHVRLTTDGEFVGVVTDHGVWREPERGHSYRGRGIALMSGVVDHLHVGRGADGGTVVTLRHRLARPVVPARLGTPTPSCISQMRYEAKVEWRRTPLVRVSGPVDVSTADDLDALLRTTARGGAVDLVVDLSGVTHLGSAGVRVLHRLAAHLDAQGCVFQILAAEGSPALQVLELVGLRRSDPDQP